MSMNVRVTGTLSYEDESDLGDAMGEACEDREASERIQELLEEGFLVVEGANLIFDADIQLTADDNINLQDALEELAIAAWEGALTIWQDTDGTLLKAGGIDEPL